MRRNTLAVSNRWLAVALGITILSLLAVSGCSDSKSTNSTSGDPKFSPAIAEIVVGDTIRWTVVSGTHSVTSGTGATDPAAGVLFEADSLNPGESFSFKFNSIGSFLYFCRPHEADGMTGTVNVSAHTAKTVSVSASGVSFSPKNVTIQAGDAVKWTSSGTHTVTTGTTASAATGLIDEQLSSGQSFTFVFHAWHLSLLLPPA